MVWKVITVSCFSNAENEKQSACEMATTSQQYNWEECCSAEVIQGRSGQMFGSVS